MPNAWAAWLDPGGRRAAMALLLLAGAVRGGLLVAGSASLRQDPDAYRLIAEHIASDGVYSRTLGDQTPSTTAFRPPLYPLVLSLFCWNGQLSWLAVAGCHLALGLATVFLAWQVSLWCGLGARAWLVAALVTVDPILLNQSRQVMTETLATFTALLAFAGLVRWQQTRRTRWAAGSGVALGLAALCRPTFLIWAACCWCVAASKATKRREWTPVLVVALGLVATLMPWVVRNELAIGRPVVATTHGGYTLLLGNNALFYHHLTTAPWGTTWDASALRPLVLVETQQAIRQSPDLHPELAADRRLYQLAWRTIGNQPAVFAKACLVRVGRLWRPWPHPLQAEESWTARWMRWLVGTWYVGWFAVVLGSVWRLRRRLAEPPWLWIVLLAVTLTVVHAFYWSNLRMRAPVMPGIYLLALVGWGRSGADREE